VPEPLEGYTVVELAVAVQGPAAALYLRDMGAEVIKVEPPLGDPSRHGRGKNNKTPEETPGPQFVAVNRGKRSVCLDLTTDLGSQALLGLLANADVLLTNYRVPALAKLGLDYATLHTQFPQLIHASVNGFGPIGDDAGKAMLDGAAIARGGLSSVTGSPDAPPGLPGAASGDTAGAMQLALAVVTALLARERHGGGQQVTTSALGAQLWLQQWELTHTAMTGHVMQRDGSHHPNLHGPYGVYATADGGAIMLASTMELDNWDAFCTFADAPELAFDPRLQTPNQRRGEGMTDADAAEIRARLEVAFVQKTALEWDAFLRTQPEIIWERVRTYDEVLVDPQSSANNYITEVDVPGVGACKTIGNLVGLSETPGSVKGDPPGLGEANNDYLTAIGLDADQIEEIQGQASRVREAALALLATATKGNE
jgi:formyl-CoA transferase